MRTLATFPGAEHEPEAEKLQPMWDRRGSGSFLAWGYGTQTQKPTVDVTPQLSLSTGIKKMGASPVRVRVGVGHGGILLMVSERPGRGF